MKKLFFTVITILFSIYITTPTNALGVVSIFNLEDSIKEVENTTGLPSQTSNPILTVLVTTMNWILAIFLTLALISFVVTGLQLIFSFGRSIEQAKKNFTYSIIAVLVVGGSLVIINTINRVLNNSI